MKKTTLALLFILSTVTSAFAGSIVNQRYCDKTIKEVVEELQVSVDQGVTTTDYANRAIKMVRNICEAAIEDRMTKKDFESLFETMEAKECMGITDEVNELMQEYNEESRRVVADNLNVICTDSVLKKEIVLFYVYKVDVYLKELGLR